MRCGWEYRKTFHCFSLCALLIVFRTLVLCSFSARKWGTHPLPLFVPTAMPVPLPCCLALIPSGLLPADRKHKNTRRLNHNHSSDYLHNASYTSFVFAPAACERALRGLHIDGDREGEEEWKRCTILLLLLLLVFYGTSLWLLLLLLAVKLCQLAGGHYRVHCSRASVTSSHLVDGLTKPTLG